MTVRTSGRTLTNLPICRSCSRLYDVRVEYHGHAASCRFCDDLGPNPSTVSVHADAEVEVPPLLDDLIARLTIAGLGSGAIGRRLGLTAGAVRVRRTRMRRRLDLRL